MLLRLVFFSTRLAEELDDIQVPSTLEEAVFPDDFKWKFKRNRRRGKKLSKKKKEVTLL